MNEPIKILLLSLAMVSTAFASCNPAELGKRLGEGAFVGEPAIKSGQPLGYLCTRTVAVAGERYRFDVVAGSFYESEINYCTTHPVGSVALYEPEPGRFVVYLRYKKLRLRSCYPAIRVAPSPAAR